MEHARGIGILLVVYGHTSRGLMNAGVLPETPVLTLLDQAIYSFHMPLFFFLSGLFFLASIAKRGRVGFVLSKVDTLLYPYVLWSLLQGGLRVATAGSTNGGGVSAWDVLALWRPIDQFWFLFGLFFVFLIAAVPFPRSWPPRTGVAALGLLVLLIYTTPLGVPLVWQELYVFPYLAYFVLAVACTLWVGRAVEPARGRSAARRLRTLVAGWSEPALGWALVGGGLLLLAALAAACGDGLLGDRAAFSVDARTLLVATAGVTITCGVARLTAAARVPLLAGFGALSMLIYVSHTLAASSLRILLQKAAGLQDPWLHLLFGLAVSLALPFAVDRFLPRSWVAATLRAPRWLATERLAARRTGDAGRPSPTGA